MKFPRFYNPFKLIRQLRERAENAEWALGRAHEGNRQLCASRDTWIKVAREFGAEIDRHEQAVAAFMDERAELKHTIAAAIRAGAKLMGMYLVEAAGRVEIERTSQEQAAETVETVTYIKQVEAALAAAGITVTDAEAGPQVVVEEILFMRACENSLPLGPGIRALAQAA
ncbi:hypothetical protein [Sphingomonas asaccharolytica]|uniref:hypothetical protein n=1 Tax=Sphingomonas asaccharolytica TaxID=40681 RepID=UPI00083399E2|nr:hypothetical protein [Sphingomonas asaccharolytica]